MDVDDLDGVERQILELLVEGFSVPDIAGRLDLSEPATMAQIKVVFAKITATNWRRTFDRIRRFIEVHGHSQVPKGYKDEHGRLRPLVDDIRRYHAQLADDLDFAGWADPYPGTDFADELDRLPGWEWWAKD